MFALQFSFEYCLSYLVDREHEEAENTTYNSLLSIAVIYRGRAYLYENYGLQFSFEYCPGAGHLWCAYTIGGSLQFSFEYCTAAQLQHDEKKEQVRLTILF